jgi:hypothetical protein
LGAEEHGFAELISFFFKFLNFMSDFSIGLVLSACTPVAFAFLINWSYSIPSALGGYSIRMWATSMESTKWLGSKISQ